MKKVEKRLVAFLTGTRADFGKMLPLIRKISSYEDIEVEIVATGMHLLEYYGSTIKEIYKENVAKVFPIFNQNSTSLEKMDIVLANTIVQLSHYLNERRPDLVFVHGDRVEALAGSIAGSLNNILVGHIEGGEVSGTIDDSMRHAISKMAHIHFVANSEAQNRLLQMGEQEDSIFVIGSPEVDMMLSPNLPTLEAAKQRYGIPFDEYAIFTYHPVTTELDRSGEYISNVINALSQTGHNYVIIKPNNDVGSEVVNDHLSELLKSPRVMMFPSIRFNYYLSLLKGAKYIIGNSSSGVREAAVFGVPCVNIGSRQNNRVKSEAIFNVRENTEEIVAIIDKLPSKTEPSHTFGDGMAADRMASLIEGGKLWSISIQKSFVDRQITPKCVN